MNKFNSGDKVVPHSKTITGPSLQSFASFKDCCRDKYIIVSDYKDGVIRPIITKTHLKSVITLLHTKRQSAVPRSIHLNILNNLLRENILPFLSLRKMVLFDVKKVLIVGFSSRKI